MEQVCVLNYLLTRQEAVNFPTEGTKRHKEKMITFKLKGWELQTIEVHFQAFRPGRR